VEPRSPFARLATAAAVALVAAGVLVGCGSGPLAPAPAATVDGVEIPRQEVDDFLAASERFYEQVEEIGLGEEGQSEQLLSEAKGAGADTIARSEVDAAVRALIQAELVRAELARNDALPTEADIEAVRAEFATQYGSEVVAQIDADYLDFAIESRANVAALQRIVAERTDAEVVQPDAAEVEAQREARYLELVEEQPYCVNAIQVATAEEAQAALDRIEAGESFATVADEVSLLEAPGGFLGCGSLEQVQQLAGSEATSFEAGQRFGPIEAPSADGAVQSAIVEIVGVDGPTRDQAQGQLESEIPSEIPPTDPASVDANAALVALYEGAEIEVDPRFGSWNPETLALDPPVGGTTTTQPVLTIPGG
jgi:hypothetical protein